ncbi:hypothetical protein B5X24_HaOG204941, partial [Helicoverpa armigera]
MWRRGSNISWSDVTGYAADTKILRCIKTAKEHREKTNFARFGVQVKGESVLDWGFG